MTASSAPTLESRWTEATIQERSRVLRLSLLARGEPAAALEACAPGGAENQVEDALGAAITEYALLRAKFALKEWQAEDTKARAHEALARALSNSPVDVRLTLTTDERKFAVYPKSFHALKWCDSLDRALSDVVGKAQTLEDLDVRAMAPLMESLAARLWVWILTSPDPWLPFDEGRPPEPPEWTGRLAPEDLLALLRAHLEVNRERVALVTSLFPPEREHNSKLPLAGFLGTVAHELGHRPSDVLTRWSLGEAFAQAVVAAQAAREARAAAKEG